MGLVSWSNQLLIIRNSLLWPVLDLYDGVGFGRTTKAVDSATVWNSAKSKAAREEGLKFVMVNDEGLMTMNDGFDVSVRIRKECDNELSK